MDITFYRSPTTIKSNGYYFSSWSHMVQHLLFWNGKYHHKSWPSQNLSIFQIKTSFVVFTNHFRIITITGKFISIYQHGILKHFLYFKMLCICIILFHFYLSHSVWAEANFRWVLGMRY